jgi:hypothetical protein
MLLWKELRHMGLEVSEAAEGFCYCHRKISASEVFFPGKEGGLGVADYVQLEKQNQLSSTQNSLTQTHPHLDSVLNKLPR